MSQTEDYSKEDGCPYSSEKPALLKGSVQHHLHLIQTKNSQHNGVHFFKVSKETCYRHRQQFPDVREGNLISQGHMDAIRRERSFLSSKTDVLALNT